MPRPKHVRPAASWPLVQRTAFEIDSTGQSGLHTRCHCSSRNNTYTRMCQVYLKRVFWVILQDRRQEGFGSRRDEPISGHARKQGAYSLTNNLTLLNISVACNKISLQASSPIVRPWLIGLWRYYCATVTPGQNINSRYNTDWDNTRRQ